MPQFDDDIFLGAAPTSMGVNTFAALGNPAPMPDGVGPVGRIYVWDTVPATKQTNNLVTTVTPAAAGSLTLTAGTSVTAVTTAAGVTAYQLDVPRAVSVTQAAGGTARNYTVSGFDYYGQPMSEVIASVASSTVNGLKAFWQVTSIAVNGGTTTAVTVGTSDVLGSPVRFTDRAYLARVGWDNTLAENAATTTPGDATTATTATGDVRGTVVPATAPNGTRRLVVAILLSGIQCGPNSTRAGALGVTQA